MITRIPYHEESERAILGICLFNGVDSIEEVLMVPNASELFHDDRHAEIWARLENLYRENKPLDIAMVAKAQVQFKVELEYLSQLASESLPAANLAQYLAIAIEYQKRRLVICIGMDLINHGQQEDKQIDEVMAQAETSMFGIRETVREEKTIKSGLNKVLDGWEHAFNHPDQLTGLPTGIYGLDKMTWGFQKQDLIVIGARPSQGKTALLGTIIAHCAVKQKVPTLLFSLESSMEEILRRVICVLENLDIGKLREGKLSQSDFMRIKRAREEIHKSPIHIIDDGSLTISQVRSIARRYSKKHGVQLIGLDYIQKCKAGTKHEKRTYEVGQVSEGLKEMGKECNVPVLAAAQLNRESDKEKGRIPRLSDFGDSGQIERDADVAALLYRLPDQQQNTDTLDYRIIIAKHRNGETGYVPVQYRKACTRFENHALE